jgi:GNAT superfamily N-acetyltransferase
MEGRLLTRDVIWRALTGSHARYAVGTGAVRRYAPGYSPIAAFADPMRPDLEELARLAVPGERLYLDGWTGPPPANWQVDAERLMLKMSWEGPDPGPDDFPGAVRLGPTHVAEAMALAELTRPGPFGPRTMELGDYFGCFEKGRLVAMAGERMQVGSLREISGVCTHPDFQGRGLARRLTEKLIRRQLARGETPFLHVIADNDAARVLYERMGFVTRYESMLRIVRIESAGAPS